MNRNIHRQIAEERGVDIRNPSSALFGVSSQDRFVNANQRAFNNNLAPTPYSFKLNSGQNFLYGYFTRIALTEVKFTWAMPTLTESNNQMIILYNTGGLGNATLTIPVGFYTPTTLAAAVQTQVLAIPGNPLAGFTVVADPVTGLFAAASNNANTFAFVPLANQNPLSQYTGVWSMMNWTPQNAGVPILATTQRSGLPTMLRTQFVDIVCSQLTYNQDVKDGDTGTVTRDILARVYLTPELDGTNPEMIGSQPFQIYRQYAFPKQIKWNPNQPITSGLQFEVYDDQGNLLTSGNPVTDSIQPDWNITLLVSEV